MRWRVLWRCVLAAAIIAFVLFIVNYHLPFSGVKAITYDFRGPDGTISHAYPVARVRDMARANDRTYRPMIEDPVYFDIKTLVPYTTAHFDLIYENTTAIPLSIGMKLPNSDPAFDLKPLMSQTPEGKWSRGSVSFDLSRASHYNGKYTFAFSVSGLRTEMNSSGEVRLSHMILTLERDPLSWNDVFKIFKLP